MFGGPNISNQKFLTFDESSFQDVSLNSFLYLQSLMPNNNCFPIQVASTLGLYQAKGRIREVSYNKEASNQAFGLVTTQVPLVPISEIELYEVTYEGMQENQIQFQNPNPFGGSMGAFGGSMFTGAATGFEPLPGNH